MGSEMKQVRKCSRNTSLGSLSAEVLAGPRPVHVVGAVEPLEEVRDPPGAALGERDPERRELLDHPRPQQVGGGLADVHRLQRDHHVDRGVGRGDRQLARRAEVDADSTVPVSHERLPQRVPVRRRGSSGSPSVAGFSVKVSEWQPIAATRRTSSAVELRVPQHRDGHRDEAVGVGAAPPLDVPVVVGPHDRLGQVLVLGAEEQPARERRERREVHRREHAAGAHVLHPLVDVVAAGPHLVEGGRARCRTPPSGARPRRSARRSGSPARRTPTRRRRRRCARPAAPGRRTSRARGPRTCRAARPRGRPR